MSPLSMMEICVPEERLIKKIIKKKKITFTAAKGVGL
jgi:hypothetical protein